MSKAMLREAFNLVAEPRYSCVQAALIYERDPDVDGKRGAEWQVLKFHGRGTDGNTFDVRSERLPPNTDVFEAAKATAQALLDKQEPVT